MRGKLIFSIRDWRDCGLIPAYAGKTCFGLRLHCKRGAHPRVCGENPPAAAIVSATAGSSPRMRGKLRAEWGNLPLTGLIPAYAGKTGAETLSDLGFRAHPRVCGENFHRADAPLEAAGSSPRMRGKLSMRLS